MSKEPPQSVVPPAEPAAGKHRRAIRSFVVRAGRMTTAQQRAWETLWPRYGIEASAGTLDLDALFGRSAPRTLEIGFGNGENLLACAAEFPQCDYLGIEVHPPGVGHLLLRAEELGLANLRVLCSDAVDVLRTQLPHASLAELLLYFPDPWPKKRHHKRRIVQPEFVALVARALAPRGRFRLATDWQPYALHMQETVGACSALRNLADDGGFVARPESRPLTRFERRGQRLGHELWDLAFERR